MTARYGVFSVGSKQHMREFCISYFITIASADLMAALTRSTFLLFQHRRMLPLTTAGLLYFRDGHVLADSIETCA